ncbi:MAG: site-specific DNA-methyltransferase [Candidatus Margulisbacteria bacterium]|nr:site-specific DNA-methyltransferase [Candidatus Margulisiibacteriota bacterium]MBU1021609.1 site-specific DNA-methyltransferase [Candidatus Margulisiibacteriota bacterium]MBU1728760.1 site-specific DNA-methyltransferase [Candidatus Margulisiibacteriota bacterium]MBU1955726.1 site-specific DNA-methyltransferase [Candidatus Margulisiibacteriota bacterium]
MAQLKFKGKQFVQNLHLSVKYHELVPVKSKSLTKEVSLNDNLIIHGDNLLALKALLPAYAGKVKCIYIDPPYNTGNEKWAYNDNVNSPMMQEWLGKVVDKDDLTRHDKWLCMMMPRLKLLRELLSDNGVIFISIDDNEINNLRMLMDDIFGEHNFIGCLVVQLNPRGRTLDRFIAKTHEYILLYSKNALLETSINLVTKEGEALSEYNKEDKKGKFRKLELRNRNPVFNRNNRPNLFFPIYVNPRTEKVSLKRDKTYSVEVLPRNSEGVDGCWTWGQKKVKENTDILLGRKVSTGAWRIYRKDYLLTDDGKTAVTKAKALWIEKEINNENGKEVLREIFNGESPFDFPKSVDLIKKCIKLGSGDNDIVLDSFSGSGTTAHAVLDLNKEDGGNRKFVLVECEDYADKITAERIRRITKGVPKAKDEELKKGLDGSFSFFELGKPIEIENILSGKNLPSFKELARYVFYTATGEEFKEKEVDIKSGYIGENDEYEVYLFYKPDLAYLKNTALTLDRAKSLGPFRKKKRLVFAPTKYLDQEFLDELRIEFAQLPFEIYRMAR